MDSASLERAIGREGSSEFSELGEDIVGLDAAVVFERVGRGRMNGLRFKCFSVTHVVCEPAHEEFEERGRYLEELL